MNIYDDVARFGTCFMPITAVGAVPPRSGDKHGCMIYVYCIAIMSTRCCASSWNLEENQNNEAMDPKADTRKALPCHSHVVPG